MKQGHLETRSNNDYHKNAILRSEDFVQTYLCPDKRVYNSLSTERYRQVTEKRNRLKPIVESIIFRAAKILHLEDTMTKEI